VLLLLTTALVVAQSGRFQTWLAKLVAQKLTVAIGAKVDIKSIKINFFDRVSLEGFYVEDLHHDTLLYVDALKANFDDVYLNFSHFDFDKVVLQRGQFNVRQFEGEDDLNIQFILDAINGPDDPTDTVKSKPTELFFWKVKLEDVNFTYEFRDTIPDTGFGINYDHIRIENIYADLNKFMVIDDSLSGEIRNFKCKEHSGLEVKNLNTDFTVAYTTIDLSNLKVQLKESNFTGKVHFNYSNYDALSDFITDVKMQGKIKRSSILLSELAYFSPELLGFNTRIDLKGDFNGKVNDLKCKNVQLSFGKNSRLLGSLDFKGLPNIDSTLFNFQLAEVRTTKSDLETLYDYPFSKNKQLEMPDLIGRLGLITYRGKLTGKIHDLKVDGNLGSNLGKLSTQIALKLDKQLDDYKYVGFIKTEEFDIGTLVDEKQLLGKIAIETTVNGTSFSPEKLIAELNGTLPFIDLNGYHYQNISINGAVQKQIYDGKLTVSDPNLRLNFNGIVDLSVQDPHFDFHAYIDKADMNALGLLKRDSSFIISTEINSGFTGKRIDDLIGKIELAQTEVKYGSVKYNVEDILLEANGNSLNKELSLLSDMFDAHIKGVFQLVSLPNAVSNVLNSFLPTYAKIKSAKNDKIEQKFNWDLTIKNINLLSALFFPEIKVGSKTKLNGEFNTERNQLKLDLNSPIVEIAGIKLNDFSIKGLAKDHKLDFITATKELQIDDSLKIKDVSFTSSTVIDSVNLKLKWSSKKELNTADAEINMKADFKGEKITMNLLPSLILITDTLWQVNEGNAIIFQNNKIEFVNVGFIHNAEFIRLDGLVSKDPADELDIIFDNFGLNNLNPFIINNGLELEGATKGIISISNLFKMPFFESNLEFKKITLNKDLIGDGQLISKWDEENNKIIINGLLKSGLVPKISFNGSYAPYQKQNSLDLDLVINNFKIDVLKKYVDDIFSDISGLADGTISLTGTPEKLETNGKVTLKRTSLKVGLLNTRYNLADDIIIKNNLIQAKNITLTDENQNTAKLDFKINHKYFTDFYFDILINAKRLQALNTTEDMSDLFFGKANVTGNFRATGPIDNIKMNINAKTERGTVFYLPLTGTGDVSQQDFIVFEKKENRNKIIKNKLRVAKSKGYELNFNLEITPDAEAYLLFDPKVGDVIKGNGTANLRLEVTEAGDFNIYGDYLINEGDYLFTLQNVINKKFVVRKGGVISFKGDPYGADINLSAVYNVQTSLYNLVKNIDSSATVKRRIDVNAVMNLSDKLMRPKITFDIQLPNADEQSRNLLASQITSDEEMNRQIFALVMFRNFWPNQGGANQATSIGGVGANASELLSAQLSNMLSQLSDDVNIGVNYQQGNTSTKEAINVTLSTKFFNDKVSVDGNFGTQATATTTTNTSNLVGEFNIEVKLTPDGAVRIKVFNRSNQYLLVTNDVPYTQGVGIFYRKEFDVFDDLRNNRKKIE
jgi:hypothetical protein